MAKAYDSTYTQYVDDITISGPRHIGRLGPTVEKIVRQSGLKINPSKTNIRDRNEEQIVTGVRVDHGIDVPKEKINAVQELLLQLREDKGKGVIFSKHNRASIRGKIRYITSLNRGAGKHLRRQFNKIIN